MKKQIITIAIMLMGVSAFSQNCIFGNTEIGNFEADVFPANTLLGVRYILGETKTLNAANLIGNNTGAKVRMAVYSDYKGSPDQLIVATDTATITTSPFLKIPVSPIELEAGDYWVMAVYDQPGNHTYINFDAIGNEVYYSPLTFGEEIPTDASDFGYFKGPRLYSFFNF